MGDSIKQAVSSFPSYKGRNRGVEVSDDLPRTSSLKAHTFHRPRPSSWHTGVALVIICNFIFFVPQEDKLLEGKNMSLVVAISVFKQIFIEPASISQAHV